MLRIPETLAASCGKTSERTAWLDRLPDIVQCVQNRWSLTPGEPFCGEDVSCAWVSPVTRRDGTFAVLKLGMPHMEGEHEIQGLRFWNGDPTVRLLEADEDLGALLLERCQPGTKLRVLPEPEQDEVIAGLLLRLWRPPAASNRFRSLAALMKYWSTETLAVIDRWPDHALVREGLRLFEQLSRNAPAQMLLATDLHAGNVLRSEREPWLVIDPKPFVGDPAYDATQHLLNCRERLLSNPHRTIRHLADMLGLDHERVRLWTFARLAAEPRNSWSSESVRLARTIAP